MASSWRVAGSGREGGPRQGGGLRMECARALFSFGSRQKDEISFKAGDVLEVLSRDGGDWWVLRDASHRVGLGPSNYLETIAPTGLIARIEGPPPQNAGGRTEREGGQHPLPPGWGSAIDPETGAEYFFEWGKGESQWEPPRFEAGCGDTVSSLSCDEVSSDIGSKVDDEYAGPDAVDPEQEELAEVLKMEEPLPIRMGGFAEQALVEWGDEESNNQDEEILPTVLEFSASKRDLFYQQLPQISAVSVPSLSPAALHEDSEPSSARSSIMAREPTHLRLPLISITTAEASTEIQGESLPTISGRDFAGELNTISIADKGRGDGAREDIQSSSPLNPKMPDALRRAVVVPLISHDEAADPGIIGPHLALDYVHGYNGDISARNAIHHNAHSSVSQKNNPNRLNRNIFWLNDYVILFPAATIVVAMSVFEQSSSSAVGSSRDDYLPQQFFTHHTDEVTALAVHRGDASATLTSTLVASGQTGKVGKVFIWNPAKVLDTFDRHFRSGAPPISNGCSQNVSRSAIIREIELSPDCRGIHSLSFSPDGIILLVMGLDEGRTMYLYNSVPQGSENEFLLAKIRLGYTDISYVGFNDHLYIPFGTSDSSYGKDKKNSSNHDRILESGGGCYTITSCRSKSVKFWTLHQYRELAQGVVEVSGFKGRRVLLPKRLQQWTTKYSLVGGTSFLPRGRNNIRLNDTDFEITCCCVVKDSEGLGTALPTARTLTGTSTGAVFVWRQEEATEIDDIYSIILGGNKSHGRAHRGRANENPNPLDIMNAGIFWKPKGVFLYVITDLHDGGIIDIDHWTRDGSSQGLLLTTGRDRTINMWTMSKKDQNGIPVDHVNTFRLVANSSATTVQDSQLGLESLGDREDGASQSALDASIGGVGTSISISPDGNHAIVGSTGNCIFLMSKLSGGEKDSSMMCIHRCHVGSASRIALHPEGDLYLTTSSDKTVRIWSALRKRQLGLIYAREQVSCGAFSIDGHVALGLGALGSMLIFRLNEDKDGALTPTLVLRKNIVSAKSKQPGGREPSPPRNSNGRNPKSNSDEKRDTEITDMSYSPSGSVLAVALSSGRIYLLSAEEKYKRFAVCKGHNYPIARITFSADGALLLSGDSGRELVYWNAITGQQIMNVRSLRDVDWVAWNSTCGWPVEGLMRDSEPGLPADLVSLCRPSGSKYILAGNQATNQGETLRLCPFPYVDSSGPDFGRYVGHSAVAADVAVMKPHSMKPFAFAVSVGGTGDACVLQWKLNAPM